MSNVSNILPVDDTITNKTMILKILSFFWIYDAKEERIYVFFYKCLVIREFKFVRLMVFVKNCFSESNSC